jgi:starch synthase (maltosyl-transferring)
LFRHSLRIVEHLLALGFDGFRCDAAYQIPAQTSGTGSFARRRRSTRTRASRPRRSAVPPTKPARRRAPDFDYVFNSSKWWDMHGWWLIEQYNLIRETTASISFPESHDTPRLCEELNGNVAGLKQRYLFSAHCSPPGVMMPMGYEFGARKPLHVVQHHPAGLARQRRGPPPLHRQGERHQAVAFRSSARKA